MAWTMNNFAYPTKCEGGDALISSGFGLGRGILSLGPTEEYLRKASEAEMQQGRAKSAAVKESWERVVVGYLELAAIAKRRDSYGLTGETWLP